MSIDNYFKTGEITPLYSVCFFILDRLNSIAIPKLNVILDVLSVCVEQERKRSQLEKRFCFNT